MNKLQLKKYAKLLAKTGLNVKKGQTVFVNAELDQPEFVEMVVEELYRAGASNVIVEWTDQPISLIDSKYKNLATLSKVYPWEEEKLKFFAKELPCRLYIESSDPDGMNGCDQEKLSLARQAKYPIIKPYRDAIENKYQWCIAAVPGKKWAKKVFPDLIVTQAVEKLWDKILMCARANGADPIKEWAFHNDELARRCDYLNGLNLKYLQYKNSKGTDLKVGLIPQAQFMGGGESTQSGRYFNANIPSEEIYISPKAGDAEGIVYSTKPLSYQGELIEDFSLRFENGKVVEVKAKKNVDLLNKMISMDEGASLLGECALIPYDSPINNADILFYNTLFDENASCHLALGMGFSNCLLNYENYTMEEAHKMGINDSMIHVDFMIGSKDLSIVGITENGQEIEIFKNGNWAFEI